MRASAAEKIVAAAAALTLLLLYGCAAAGGVASAFSVGQHPTTATVAERQQQQQRAQRFRNRRAAAAAGGSTKTTVVVLYAVDGDSAPKKINEYEDFPIEGAHQSEYTGAVDWDAEWKKVVKEGGIRTTKPRPGKEFYKSEAEIAAIVRIHTMFVGTYV
jgi:hypothetical protein